MSPETPQTPNLTVPDRPRLDRRVRADTPHRFAPKTPKSPWCRVCDQKWWREIHKVDTDDLMAVLDSVGITPGCPTHSTARTYCPTCGVVEHNDPPDFDCPER